MQFEIRQPYELPQKIEFNYAEMKRELTEKTEMYKTMVYTDDQINEAKADRANLNKAKKALNDERLRLQKEYMKPFDEFKAQVDDLIKTIDEASAAIDKQVKEYEKQYQKEKEDAIREIFPQIGFQPFVKLEQIWNPKWLNKSYKASQIVQDMRTAMYNVSTALMTLDQLPEKEVAVEYYKRTLNLQEAIQKAQEHAEIEKRKAEADAARLAAEEARKTQEAEAKQEPTADRTDCAGANENSVEAQKDAPEVKRAWIGFKAFLSREEAGQLKMFFDSLGIEFKPL